MQTMCQAVGLYMLLNSTPYKNSEGGKIIPIPQIQQSRNSEKKSVAHDDCMDMKELGSNPAAQPYSPCDGLCGGAPSAVKVKWDPHFPSLATTTALRCQQLEGWQRTFTAKLSPEGKPDPCS